MFKGTDFRSDSSSFSFKYHRVKFLFCELAGAVHESSDFFDGCIVLEDAVDVKGDDWFERVTVEPMFSLCPVAYGGRTKAVYRLRSSK